MRFKSFISIILVFILINSCSHKNNTPVFSDSGMITYDITYTNELDDPVQSRFMPQNIIINYSGEKLNMDIQSELNIFSINVHSPGPVDSSFINFHFMGKDLSYKLAPHDFFFLYNFSTIPDIEIHKEDSVILADMVCYKAMIKPQNQKAYEVYFTDKLPIQNPNRHTPLSKIPGMLMAFPITYNGLCFHVKANKFENTKKEDLKEREYCINSSNEEVEKLIKSLINVIN